MTSNGNYLSLAQVVKLLPPGRQSKSVSPTTIFRWIRHGLRGPDGKRVHLAGVRCGARWLVEPDALDAFTRAMTPVINGTATTAPPIVTTTRTRTKAKAAAAKENQAFYRMSSAAVAVG